MAQAVGVATINLLPPAKRKVWARTSQIKGLFTIGTAALVILAILLLVGLSAWATLQLWIATARSQKVTSEEQLQRFGELEEDILLIVDRAQLLKTLPLSKVANHLTKLTETLPEGVSLTSLVLNETATPAVKITGTAQSRQKVVDTIKALEETPDFAQVEYQSSTQIEGSTINFTLQANLEKSK